MAPCAQTLTNILHAVIVIANTKSIIAIAIKEMQLPLILQLLQLLRQ